MKRGNRIFGICLALIVAIAMCTPAFACSISKSKALDKALKNEGLTKAQVKVLKLKKESKKQYEVKFIKLSTCTEYEYELNACNGKITEKEVKYCYKRCSSKSKIGKKQARKIVAKASGVSVKKIKKGSCKYKYKGNKGYYKIKFRSGKKKYSYKVLAPTGAIMEYEWERVR